MDEQERREAVNEVLYTWPLYKRVLKKNPKKYEKLLKQAISSVHDAHGEFIPEFLDPSKVVIIAEGNKEQADMSSHDKDFSELPEEKKAEKLARVLENQEKYRPAFIVKAGQHVNYKDQELLKYLKDVFASKALPKKIRYADLGCSDGHFSAKLLRTTDKEVHPTLLDARKVNVSKHKTLDRTSKKISYYDITNKKENWDWVKEQHIIVCKQVMKFHQKTRGRAFEKLKQHMSHGSILITGGPANSVYDIEKTRKNSLVTNLFETNMPYTVAKMFVKVKGEEPMLVRLNAEKFVGEIKNIDSRKKYLKNLHNIIKKTAAEHTDYRRKDGKKVIKYKRDLKTRKRNI